MKNMMMSVIAISILMILSACSQPNIQKPKKQAEKTYNNEWVNIAESRDRKSIYEFNIRSYNENKNYVSMISQNTVTKYSTSTVYLERKYVSKRTCQRGVGKVITKNLDGKIIYRNDYVRNGSSISSALGDALCYMYSLRNR